MLWKRVTLTFSCLIVSLNAKSNLPSANELIDNGDGLETESINSHLTSKEDAISVPPARQITCTNDVTKSCRRVCIIVVTIKFAHKITICLALMVILAFYIAS